MNDLTLGKKGLPGYNPYAKVLTGTAREKLLEAQRVEEDLDLRNEIHMLRMKMMEALEGGEDGPSTKEILEINRELRQTISTMSTLVDKLQGYIPVSMLEVIFNQIVQVVKANVKDSNAIQRITQQLGRIRVPANQSEAERLDREVSQGNLPS